MLGLHRSKLSTTTILLERLMSWLQKTFFPTPVPGERWSQPVEDRNPFDDMESWHHITILAVKDGWVQFRRDWKEKIDS